jgi:hypothetical protein
LPIKRLLEPAMQRPHGMHEMHRDERLGRGACRHLGGVSENDRQHAHAVADVFYLELAQFDVLSVHALHVEGRELRIIVEDHHARDVVEAAVVLPHPGGESDQFLFIEALLDRYDAARPRAVRVQHRVRLFGRERKAERLLQQLD